MLWLSWQKKLWHSFQKMIKDSTLYIWCWTQELVVQKNRFVSSAVWEVLWQNHRNLQLQVVQKSSKTLFCLTSKKVFQFLNTSSQHTVLVRVLPIPLWKLLMLVTLHVVLLTWLTMSSLQKKTAVLYVVWQSVHYVEVTKLLNLSMTES